MFATIHHPTSEKFKLGSFSLAKTGTKIYPTILTIERNKVGIIARTVVVTSISRALLYSKCDSVSLLTVPQSDS